MDISNYKDLKESQNIELVKIGNSFAVVKKQYNTDTGKLISPIIEAIDKENVLKLKDNLLKQLIQIDELLNDIDIHLQEEK